MAKIIGNQNKKWEKIDNGIEGLNKILKELPPEIKNNINKNLIDIDEIKNIVKNLKNQKFTISVCGVVKAGKSTFLNAYLFGNEILPKFATPLTAKLNFIEYTDGKDYFEVNFYSKSEWENLLNTYKNLSSSDDEEEDKEKIKYKEALDRSIELCFQRGISENNCIDKPSKKIEDLSKIGEYVADPTNAKFEAKYTPFVKDIHIYIHNERIKNCRIVDTPGLYDPNPINSAETLNWLDKSHAIIFILPKKGFTGADEKLFQTELRALKPEQRIFVINRIDELNSLESAEEVRKYVRDLGVKNDSYKRLRLFDKNEIICLYSAIIDLMQKKQQNGIPLTDKESKYLSRSFVKNPDPDKISEKIENRLFNNSTKLKLKRGADIITKKYNLLNDIIDDEKATVEERINDCKKSEEDLNTEIKSLRKIEGELEDLTYKTSSERSQKITNLIFSLANEIKNRSLYDCVPNIDIISSNSDLRYIGTDFKKDVSSLLGKYGAFESKINKTFEDFIRFLVNQSDEIRNIFIKNNIPNRVVLRHLDDYNRTFDIEEKTIHILDDLEKILDDILPYNLVTQCLNPFNWPKNFKSEVKEVVRKKIEIIKHSIDNILSEVEKELLNFAQKNISDIIKSVQAEYREKEKSIKQKKDEKEKDLQQFNSLLKEYDTIIKRIKSESNKFKVSIEGVCEL